MANQDPELWEKASDARETLERNLAEDQEVGYVDIGCGQSEADANAPSLRIHVWGEGDEGAFPHDVEGIPVVISRDRDDS